MSSKLHDLVDILYNVLPYEIIEKIYDIYLNSAAITIQKKWRKYNRIPYTNPTHCRFTCFCPFCIKWRMVHYHNRESIVCNNEHLTYLYDVNENNYIMKYRNLLSYRCYNEFNIYPYIKYSTHPKY